MRTALVCVRTPVAAQSIASCATRLGVASLRTAVTEAEVLAQLGERPAELILADTAVTRPDPVGFTRRVLALAPGAVLVLFGAEEPQVATAVVKAGARGLIRTGDQDVVGTVTKALLLIGSRGAAAAATGGCGGRPVPAGAPGLAAGPARTGPRTARESSSRPGAGGAGGGPGAAAAVVPAQRVDQPGAEGRVRYATLTERELQVLRGMAEGKSNAEIGRDLYVSEDTVKTHARRLFRKLKARDRAHAVAVGFRSGALG